MPISPKSSHASNGSQIFEEMLFRTVVADRWVSKFGGFLMIWLLRQLLFWRRAMCANDSPRQMAAGIALGLILGLVPKGNLLAILVAATLFATKTSVAAGLITAVCVSLFAPLADPLTHRIGEWLLTYPSLVPLWQRLYRLPLASWTSFNNTVVMGNLLLGMMLGYPAYRLSLARIHRARRFALNETPGDPAVVDGDGRRLREQDIPATLGISSSSTSKTVARRVFPEQRRRSA
jgi:uncharacterized protein (TIGR03546 family)